MTSTDFEHKMVMETEKYDVIGTRPVLARLLSTTFTMKT